MLLFWELENMQKTVSQENKRNSVKRSQLHSEYFHLVAWRTFRAFNRIRSIRYPTRFIPFSYWLAFLLFVSLRSLSNLSLNLKYVKINSFWDEKHRNAWTRLHCSLHARRKIQRKNFSSFFFFKNLNYTQGIDASIKMQFFLIFVFFYHL